MEQVLLVGIWFLFYCWATPGNAQGLVLGLHSGITYDGFGDHMEYQETNLGWCMQEKHLFFQPYTYDFSVSQNCNELMENRNPRLIFWNDNGPWTLSRMIPKHVCGLPHQNKMYNSVRFGLKGT